MPVVSDSDLYLDMARVFTGDGSDFDRAKVNQGTHHYNRPLFPFLAGFLAKYFFGGNLRSAFSVVDIIAAVAISMLLSHLVRNQCPGCSLYWVPSLLFLSGFPQLNWGYHILTDTLGLSTAFASACLGARLVRITSEDGWTGRSRCGVELAALFVISALAFLARETAWIAVVTTAWLVFTRRGQWNTHWSGFGFILLALIAGKVPHIIYAHVWQVTGVPLHPTLGDLLDPRHLMDFTIKTAVCFNIAWILALAAFIKRKRDPISPFIVGWTGAAMLYMGAGYLANSQAGIGYPLRMSYSLFPLIFIFAGEFFERFQAGSKRLLSTIGYCLLQYGINLTGVFLDPGRSHFRTTDVLRALKEIF